MHVQSLDSNASTNIGALTPSTAATRGAGHRDADGDGDGGASRAHGGGRSGGMGHALQQALQTLGLTPPKPSTATTAAGTTPGVTSTPSTTATATANASQKSDSDGDGDGSGAASGPSKVRQDMHQLMHALFQAIKADEQAGGATTTTDPKTAFASGLSTLITQVSNGSAPASLQSAFDALAGDLQGAGSAPAPAGSPTPANGSKATLQQLLTTLQQNLGYGAAASAAGSGNLVDVRA